MPKKPHPTACLALADGTFFYGVGFGAPGIRVAELCFNTAMTGYQEIMTDPSYAGQVITFTFPHFGNVGVNPEDDETGEPVAEGMVVKWSPTAASNWRAAEELSDWLAKRGRVAIGGIDTRRLTRAIRQQGAPHVALAYDPNGQFDTADLVEKARTFAGLEGVDLAKDVTCRKNNVFNILVRRRSPAVCTFTKHKIAGKKQKDAFFMFLYQFLYKKTVLFVFWVFFCLFVCSSFCPFLFRVFLNQS